MLSKAECALLFGFVCLMHGRRLLSHAFVHELLTVLFAEQEELRIRTSYNYTLVDNAAGVSVVLRGRCEGYDVRRLEGRFDTSVLEREAAAILARLAMAVGSIRLGDGAVVLGEYTNVRCDAHAELRARSDGLGYLLHHAYLLHQERSRLK